MDAGMPPVSYGQPQLTYQPQFQPQSQSQPVCQPQPQLRPSAQFAPQSTPQFAHAYPQTAPAVQVPAAQGAPVVPSAPAIQTAAPAQLPPGPQVAYPAWVDPLRLVAAKACYNRVALGAVVMLLTFQVIVTGAILALNAAHADLDNIWLTMFLQDFVLYLIAMPLGLLTMRSAKPVPTQQFSMTPGRFCLLLLMCLPIMYGGNIIGIVLAGLVSGGKASNSLETTFSQSVWANLVFTVIAAPLMEEWFFRKQVISRLRRFGEKPAILISAIIFGMGHANIYQFFYAFGLGLLWGWIYMRTSRLRYTIAMHMFVNLNGSILSSWAAEATERKDVWAAIGTMYLLLMMGGAIAGLVLLIVKRSMFIFYTAPEQLPKGQAGPVAFGNVGMIMFIVVAVLLTALSIISQMS